jgi:hypothetical protein
MNLRIKISTKVVEELDQRSECSDKESIQHAKARLGSPYRKNGKTE